MQIEILVGDKTNKGRVLSGARVRIKVDIGLVAKAMCSMNEEPDPLLSAGYAHN